jgi:hypothetical protein
MAFAKAAVRKYGFLQVIKTVPSITMGRAKPALGSKLIFEVEDLKEFTALVDSILGRNGVEKRSFEPCQWHNNNIRIIDDLLQPLLSDSDAWDELRKEDIQALWQNHEICGWMLAWGIPSYAHRYISRGWSYLHELMGYCGPPKSQVIDLRTSQNPDARSFSIAVFREHEGANIDLTGEGDMGLLAELLLDPDGAVRMDAIANIEYIPKHAVIQVIEASFHDEEKKLPLQHVFEILNMYLDGTLPSHVDQDWDLEDEEWDVSQAPDMLLEIGTHFKTEIEDMLNEGAAKDE